MTRRNNTAKWRLDQLVSNVVRLVQPQRVVLFGSHARGTADAYSDVDLLVVMGNGAHRRRTAQYLYERLRHSGVPFDVVVATPSDIQKHRNDSGLVYHAAIEEGRTLYVAK